MRYTVKTSKEYKAKIEQLRAQGWFIITYTKTFAELEKGEQIVIVER